MLIQALPIEQTFQTFGGRITCQRCQAMSKRTKQQCRAPAIKGKQVCKTHGGKSTGPKTQDGRRRCADARTLHGNETRRARTDRSLGVARLALLEEIGRSIKVITGPKTRGRKPKNSLQACPELCEISKWVKIKKIA